MRVFIFLSLKGSSSHDESCTGESERRRVPRAPRSRLAVRKPPRPPLRRLAARWPRPSPQERRGLRCAVSPTARPGPSRRDARSRREQNDPVGGDASGSAHFGTSGEEGKKDPAARCRNLSAVIDSPIWKQNTKHSNWRLPPRARGRWRAVAGGASGGRGGVALPPARPAQAPSAAPALAAESAVMNSALLLH